MPAVKGVEPGCLGRARLPGKSEDNFLIGDHAEVKALLRSGPPFDARVGTTAHEFADDVGVEERTHGRRRSSGAGGEAARKRPA